MKRILLLMLTWLAFKTSYAQNTNTNLNLDSRPITTQGISLPQLITTNLNRSKYQISRTMSTTFGINLNLNPFENITGLKLGLKF
jgi:hypothetical protein